MPPYANLTGDFSWVNISIDADDEEHAQAWEKAFEEAAWRERIPASWYDAGRGSETAYLYIEGPYTNATRDVSLTTVRADYLVSVATAASLIE